MRYLALALLTAATTSLAAQSPERIRLAERMVELNSSRTGVQVAESAYVAHLLQESPLWVPYQDILAQWAADVYDWHAVDSVLQVRYAAVFNEDELKQLIAFSESPVGKKLVAVKPQFQREMAALLYSRSSLRRADLAQRVRDRAAVLRKPVPKVD